MIIHGYFSFRCFMLALIVFLVGGNSCHLLGQQEQQPNQRVILQQCMFGRHHIGGDSALLAERLKLNSLDGRQIAFDVLPPKIKECITNLAARVTPVLEMKNADLREVIRMIIQKPIPKDMIRLGLIADPKVRELDPSWMSDISFGVKRLSCVVTNASFLDISIALAEAFDLDFGVMQDGQPAFRNRTSADKPIKYNLYLVKSRAQDLDGNMSQQTTNQTAIGVSQIPGTGKTNDLENAVKP